MRRSGADRQDRGPAGADGFGQELEQGGQAGLGGAVGDEDVERAGEQGRLAPGQLVVEPAGGDAALDEAAVARRSSGPRCGRRGVWSVIARIVAGPWASEDHPNVLNRGMARRQRRDRSSRPAGSADGAAQRSPDDIHDLIHVGIRLAPFGSGPDAAADVVLEDQDPDRVERRPQGRRLLEDVDAVLLALDHPGDPPDLAFDPAQAPDEICLVLRIAVPEVIGRLVPGTSVGGRGGVAIFVERAMVAMARP